MPGGGGGGGGGGVEDSCLSAEFLLDENLAVARLGPRGTNSGFIRKPDIFGVLRCHGMAVMMPPTIGVPMRDGDLRV